MNKVSTSNMRLLMLYAIAIYMAGMCTFGTASEAPSETQVDVGTIEHLRTVAGSSIELPDLPDESDLKEIRRQIQELGTLLDSLKALSSSDSTEIPPTVSTTTRYTRTAYHMQYENTREKIKARLATLREMRTIQEDAVQLFHWSPSSLTPDQIGTYIRIMNRQVRLKRDTFSNPLKISIGGETIAMNNAFLSRRLQELRHEQQQRNQQASSVIVLQAAISAAIAKVPAKGSSPSTPAPPVQSPIPPSMSNPARLPALSSPSDHLDNNQAHNPPMQLVPSDSDWTPQSITGTIAGLGLGAYTLRILYHRYYKTHIQPCLKSMRSKLTTKRTTTPRTPTSESLSTHTEQTQQATTQPQQPVSI